MTLMCLSRPTRRMNKRQMPILGIQTLWSQCQKRRKSLQTFLEGLSHHCLFLNVFVGRFFSRPSKGIAAEIFPENTFWIPSVRIWWRLWLQLAFLALHPRPPALSTSTATCPVSPLRPPLKLPQEVSSSCMVQATLSFLTLVITASLNAPGAQPHFIQFGRSISAAPSMDPSLDALLRCVNLCEQLITAFRVQEITDRELFVALDTSEESLRETCKEAFGIDTSKGFAHKRELGKIIKAGCNAKVHCDTKLKLDAVARSHGKPLSMLCADWEALRLTFKTKFVTHLHDTVLPAQSYFEGFEERLANGQLRAEQLAQVVSVREQEEQGSKKPDAQRHMSLHLDGQLTIQTKRRFLSSMPANPEELRVKYKIMTHCWLLAQMRQPGRHLYSDFTRKTLIELLSGRNFLVDKSIGDNKVVRPDWSLCMGYELELRREAIKCTREQGMAIQEALWAAYHNDHHRLENISFFLRLSGSSQSSVDKDKTVQQLQRKVADLERQMRSRSPRGRRQQLSLTVPSSSSHQLAFPAPPAPKGKPRKKGKGKGKNKQLKNETSRYAQSFQQLVDMPNWTRP